MASDSSNTGLYNINTCPSVVKANYNCAVWNKSESSRFLSFWSFCIIFTNFNMLFLMVLSSFNENVYSLQN